ncbi:MAG TPA: type III-B CRISPR module RAMP protein Cmr1 [Thermotogota bacterium]|nr:type III-B CRISPR module RAMP protein Cmr1 [Thermotogota bacterium]
MHHFQLETRTITPLFSKGLNRRGNDFQFELLPQSVKGTLRFWFRALLPNVIDIHRYGETKKPYLGMKKAEEVVFGSTQRRSAFDLMVEYDAGAVKKLGEFRPNKRGQQKFSSSLFGTYSGAGHASYGMAPSNFGDPISSYLSPNSEISFQFVLKSQPNPEVWEEFLTGLFRVVCHVGGLGAKSRNGYGSLELTNTQGGMQRKPPEIIADFRNTLSPLLSDFGGFHFQPTSLGGVPEFPVLEEKSLYMIKNLQVQGWLKGMNNFFDSHLDMNDQKKYRGFYAKMKTKALRELNGEDCVQTVRSALFDHGVSPNAFEHSVFGPSILGLPLLYQGIGSDSNHVGRGIATLKNAEGRKASPLHFTFHESRRTGNMILVMLLLPSQITAKRNQAGQPLLTLEAGNRSFSVLGNEDFEGLQQIIRDTTLEVEA